MGKTVQEIIVERLIQKIEQEGVLPWQKPFHGASMNWYSRHEYTGINKILLDAGEYITSNQLEQYNKKTGKNFWFEKGTPSDVVVFYTSYKKKISDEEAAKLIDKGYSNLVRVENGVTVRIYWVLRYYRVYNIKYIRHIKNTKLLEDPKFADGIFEKEVTTVESGTNKKKKKYKLVLKGGEPVLKEGVSKDDFEVLEPNIGNTVIEEHTPSEDIIRNYMEGTGVKLEHKGNSAYYTPLTDTVVVPPKSNFISTEAYWRTLFHEFVHSTGIKTRLNRACFEKYHNTNIERSKEELIAEVGALLLASEAGFRDDSYLAKNSENYIAGWCNWMRGNPNEVVTGFFAAEKAKNYILSGGKVIDASSTRSVDNPEQRQEDANVDVESDILDKESTTEENSESTNVSADSVGNNKGKPKEKPQKITSIKTVEEIREYFISHFTPYFNTDDEDERKRILKTITGEELRYIYKKLTKKDMPKSIKRKADALELILRELGI